MVLKKCESLSFSEQEKNIFKYLENYPSTILYTIYTNSFQIIVSNLNKNRRAPWTHV